LPAEKWGLFHRRDVGKAEPRRQSLLPICGTKQVIAALERSA